MTCLSMTHSAATPAGAVGQVANGARHSGRRTMRKFGSAVRVRVTGTGTTAQFGRFVVVGGIASSLYATVFLLLGSVGTVDLAVANLLGNTASTLLANELHRRLTFRANERVTWVTAQLEGGGLAVIGLAATSSALAWFNAAVPTASPLLQLLLVVVVTGSIGVLRFVALRAWVFHADEAAVAVPAVEPTAVPATAPAIPAPRSAGRRPAARRSPRRSTRTTTALVTTAAPAPVA